MALLGVPGSMGIGRLGAADVILTRKFRFEMEIITPNGSIVPPSFVRTSGLPSIDLDPYELNFLNEKTWISGKPSWNEITISYINAAVIDLAPLFNWLASVYNFTNPSRFMGSRTGDYIGTAIIYLYDGCGQPLQQWQLGNMFPASINFGDLAYDDSSTVDVELTMRYSNVIFTSLCPSYIPFGRCSPCGT